MREGLKNIEELYKGGTNIIKHLKSQNNVIANSPEMIRISYDLQAGTYIKNASEHPEWENKFSGAFADELNKLGDYDSILEAGVGEATTLRSIASKLENQSLNFYGFDISYSRIKYAMNYLKQHKVSNTTLFTSNMFNVAIQDSSIDVVYTSHAMEPNGGKEKEALSELYRIAKKYLVLFEPMTEFASDAAKEFIEEHGYVRDLHATALDLGYKVIEHKPIFEKNPWSPNNTGVLIIEKDSSKSEVAHPLACPISKAPLELIRNNYYCRESLLLYPVVDGIPCLLAENSIIAAHYLDELQK